MWRGFKYEQVSLSAYESVGDANADIRGWVEFYNVIWCHQGLGRHIPDQVYYGLDAGLPKREAA